MNFRYFIHVVKIFLGLTQPKFMQTDRFKQSYQRFIARQKTIPDITTEQLNMSAVCFCALYYMDYDLFGVLTKD